MRLITRSVYRAFPELDRYGDEQCVRFVKAARGGAVRRFLTGLGLALLALGIVALGGWCWALLVTERWKAISPLDGATGLAQVAGLFLFAAAMAPGPLLGYIARDIQLRRRVRFILRIRGVCQQCWYSLVGLPIEPGQRVRCPECGHQTEVDSSLGELVTDESGRQRFQPEQPPPDLRRSRWSNQQRRLIKRTLGWGTLGLVALIVLLGGGYELFLRWQAARARAAMPPPGAFEELVASLPARSGPEVDARTALQAFERRRQTIDPGVLASLPPNADGSPATPDFPAVYFSSLNRRWGMPSRITPVNRDAALRLVEAYAKDGVFEELDPLVNAGRPVWGGPTPGMGWSAMPNVWSVSQAAQIAAASAYLALEDNDPGAFAAALKRDMALVHAARAAPLSSAAWITSAAATDAYDLCRRALMTRHSPEWVAAVEEALKVDEPRPPASAQFRGDRILGMQQIAATFGDPDNVRLGPYSPVMKQMTGIGFPKGSLRLGTFSANRSAFDARMDELIAGADKDPWERPPMPRLSTSTGLALVDLSTPWIGNITTMIDAAEMQRRGLVTMVAIERFALDRAQYPDSLEALVPNYLTQIPPDPWSGKPLRYKRLDPAKDPAGRPYLLYSVGRDGQDDGGIEPVIDAKSSTVSPAGADQVLNPPPEKP